MTASKARRYTHGFYATRNDEYPIAASRVCGYVDAVLTRSGNWRTLPPRVVSIGKPAIKLAK